MKTHDDTEALEDDLDAELDALDDDPKALRRLLRGKGAKKAIRALLGVCGDPRAPAPAKATAGSALLRAGGFFEKFDAADEEAEPTSVEDLERTIERLKAHAATLPDAAPEPAPKPPGKNPEPGEAPGGLFD